MANVAVYNTSGNEVEKMHLNEAIFDVEMRSHVVHMAVVQYLANQRQGTKSAKTRAEVRGGGRKPWKQKGTGRARQGSIRSPQWKGGGVVFAPKSRDFSFKLNKKVKRLALRCALSLKVEQNKFIILDELKLQTIKTKDMKNIINNLKLEKALFILEGDNNNVILSARNLPNIKTAGTNELNVYDILKFDTFVVTKEAVNKIQEVYA
jgi:large subunit ribosomal protein L4